MKELLDDIVEKLRIGIYANEEHVRLSLVARLLQALGWDIWNPQEFNTEFGAVRSEDNTRVDIALFPRRAEPAVYLEVKAVGKIDRNLREIERQMRDYNRNNTAAFSVLTDGRKWRFYLSRTGGAFDQKCFKEFDLLDKSEAMEDIELAFHAFLSKSEIISGRALREAEQYLNSSRRQRAMRDALPMAKRDTESNPDLTLTQLLVRRVQDEHPDISEKEAKEFILISSEKIDVSDGLEPEIKLRHSIEPAKASTKRGRLKAISPRPADWLSKIPELRPHKHLTTWKDVCEHLGVEVGADSARRRLSKWVTENHPKWPSVPET